MNRNPSPINNGIVLRFSMNFGDGYVKNTRPIIMKNVGKIKKNGIDTFLKTFPLQNKEKLIRICKRFNAEVPEWPNGIDS